MLQFTQPLGYGRMFSSPAEPSSLARLALPPSQSAGTSFWVLIFLTLHRIHGTPGCSFLSSLVPCKCFLPVRARVNSAKGHSPTVCISPASLHYWLCFSLFLNLEFLILFCAPLKNLHSSSLCFKTWSTFFLLFPKRRKRFQDFWNTDLGSDIKWTNV